MKRHFVTRLGSLCLALLAAAVLAGRPALAQEKSLYERLGGVNAIAAVVDDFVDRLLKDKTITANPHVVEGMKHVTVPGLKYLLTEQVCEAAGGPQRYTGRSMKESHAGLWITEKEWQAMAMDFQKTLDKFKVPEREQKELFAAVGSTKQDVVTGR